MFKRKSWDKPFSVKIARRVSRIPTNDLIVWADQSLNELGRLLSAYERGQLNSQLEELAQGAEAFHAVIHELNKRKNIQI